MKNNTPKNGTGTEKNDVSGNEKSRSHLSLEDRAKIEYGLNTKKSVRSIAKELGKTPSTILREIQRHTYDRKSNKNNCLHRNSCDKRHACGSESCHRLCRATCGKKCFRTCEDYVKGYCDKLSESPHVCNGCSHYKFKDCMYDMQYYSASSANADADNLLHNKHAGFDLTLEELIKLDELISPLVLKGQSPYHIAMAIAPEVEISESTIYRLIASGELDARDIDLREKVRRKPRQNRRRKMKNEMVRLSKVGHMWQDYLSYMEANDVFHVEMDCVEGIKTDKAVLLTLHWSDYQMQLAFIMDNHDAKNVVETLDRIEEALGTELFQTVFPVILTDNGQEFTDIDGMEGSSADRSVKRTKVFFCEPNRSDEKGACENNHRLIRAVIPKGTSLEPYSQADISLMMNHINSYRRKKQFGKCAYDVAMNLFPEDFFILLGLKKIPDTEVMLTPQLLRHKDEPP